MKKVVRGIGLVLFAASLARAQNTAGRPRFEVASVKPAPTSARFGSMGGGPLPAGPFNYANHDPGRITWTNVRLLRVIQVAYDFPMDRISGPDWLGGRGYDIVAVIPLGTSVGDFRVMLQNLLEDRFKLAAHRAIKERSGYGLVIGKDGPKISRSSADGKFVVPKDDGKRDQTCQGCNTLLTVDASGFPAPRPGNPVYAPGTGFSATIRVNGRYRATVLNETTAEIAEFLGTAAGAPVEDRTGLGGTYNMHLEYVPAATSAAGAADAATLSAAAAEAAPDLFAAVEQQLGLKLVRKKVPVEMLVIDHAEKDPSEN